MNDIDVDFEPGSYFRPQRLEEYLLSKVKGAVLKQKLQALFDEGRHDEVDKLLGAEGISAEVRRALEAIHPRFMGGNYLPDTEDGEVEIARIRIASTTYDVTSVYARPSGGAILYRVVDEYGGDTLTGDGEIGSNRPLTLGELGDFFLGAWSLIDVLEMNFDDDLDSSLEFFTAESDFYPELDRLCRERVIKHFGDSKIARHSDEVGD